MCQSVGEAPTDRGEVDVSGRDAARGFEYQFLTTLEYALRDLLTPSSSLSSIFVDAPPPHNPGADQEIVDFALYTDAGCSLVAQVKAGIHGSTMSAVQAVKMLLRLATHRAERLLIVTNRGHGPGIDELCVLLEQHAATTLPFVDGRNALEALVAGSPETRRQVNALNPAEWGLLRNAGIVFDDRNVEETYAAVRELVRTARRSAQGGTVGWDAAGLLTGYLVSETLATAATQHTPALTREQLFDALGVDYDVLASVMRRRDWSVHVTPAPRSTDIPRNEQLNKIAECLQAPVMDEFVPVCVLAGLSGIGKTSLAAAWADDRADTYSAIFWIDATSSVRIQKSFEDVDTWFRNGHGVAPKRGDLRDAVVAALAQTPRPWLMVFDNVHDLKLIRVWMPTRGRGHVIVTSTDRTGLKGSHVSVVPVDGMSMQEATQLLIRRIPFAGPLDSNQEKSLRELAKALHFWPLALELASAYLVDCEVGIKGVDRYRALLADPADDISANVIIRSLEDDDSVPIGYPHSLVRAILLAWKRMNARSSEVDQISVRVLKLASFTASRQIPLHLLLSSLLEDPIDVVGASEPRGLSYFADWPAGEIIRALKRESLASADERLPIEAPDGLGATHEIGCTVSVNDIVQSILRREATRQGEVASILSSVAFHVQRWLAFFHECDRRDLEDCIYPHAVTVADHALGNDLINPSTALLWGNTARLLSQHEQWPTSIRYLRAEMKYVGRADVQEPVVRMQTAVSLAIALIEDADHPDLIALEATALLEGSLIDLNHSRELSELKTAHTLRMARQAVDELIDRGSRHPRLRGLQSALNDYCAMLPGAPAKDPTVLTQSIHDLIGSGRYNEALDLTKQALADPDTPSVNRPHLWCLMLECCAYLRHWELAQEVVGKFQDKATMGAITRQDVTLLLRNTGISCITGIIDGEGPAQRTLHAIVEIVDEYQNRSGRLRYGERDYLLVFRALRACLNYDTDLCAIALGEVDVASLQDTKPRRVARMIFVVLSSWLRSLSDRSRILSHREGLLGASPWKSSVGLVDSVKAQMSASMAFAAVKQIRNELAPYSAVAAAVVHRARIQGISDPAVVSSHLRRSLHLLGFDADILSAVCTVYLNVETFDLGEKLAEFRHFGVWVRDFGIFIDPALDLREDIASAYGRDVMQGMPVVSQVNDFDTFLRDGAAVYREPLYFTYGQVQKMDAAELGEMSVAYPAFDIEVLVAALHASLALGNALSPSQAAPLRVKHPQLKNILAFGE